MVFSGKVIGDLCHITQNHRMCEFGRDLWRSSSRAPLVKQGHLEQAAQDHVIES